MSLPDRFTFKTVNPGALEDGSVLINAEGVAKLIHEAADTERAELDRLISMASGTFRDALTRTREDVGRKEESLIASVRGVTVARTDARS